MEEIIYCCKLTDVGNPDLLPELLSAMEYDFSSWVDREGDKSYHILYFSVAGQELAAAEKLSSLQESWQDMGIEVDDIETFFIKKEDWAEVWKKYFDIITISERLVIKPSWLEYAATPEQVIVEIDPGMSFGTGQHATTSFCLKMIDRLADDPEVNSLLDAGCGSGILSIAAAKLGYSPIHAFDIDPDAVKIANENLADNAINNDIVDPVTVPIDQFNADCTLTYDLVVANILGHILVTNREKIFNMVKPGGYLILAGILSTEFKQMTGVFLDLGLEEEFTFTEKEWTSGLFRRV
ncbi:MAG: 50S ribosomal protein L11 methyltransferase [Victivallaceae bacterium]|nr:50S ribosomal protein L11 methyltransferase [Victivallaceae bacterium]